jgi:4-hydroxy-tetrahydrodipicolinate synthase
MKSGCYTALVTPFTQDGSQVDRSGLEKLTAFQIVDLVSGMVKGRGLCIAGTGSNNTEEALHATEHAVRQGVDAVLVVDPYYNGPSSLEIRREYVAPIARRFPQVDIIPYVIPGRTGAQLLPEDLAMLHDTYPNVASVKEATGNLDNMRRTRSCCGAAFSIFSGDDGLTYEMMIDPDISAAGVISVASNVAPKAMADLVMALARGDRAGANALVEAVSPLFDLVTVKTREITPYGEVVCRARNPLAIKTLMAVLGMPAGPCRPPLGKMTPMGLRVVLDVALSVWRDHPQILQPVVDFFNVDIEARIHDRRCHEGLSYAEY